MANLVMTVIGPDRPGLVEALAERVAAHGGNWLESRMAHLSGQFAGILHVSVPDGTEDEFMAALDGVEGMAIHLQATASATAASGRTASLDLVGNDRPGIVREITSVLADLNVNVESLETCIESAPMAAGLLFKAEAQLGLPEGLTLDELREALETLASDLMVTVE